MLCGTAERSNTGYHHDNAGRGCRSTCQFITGSEINEVTKPNMAAASYSHNVQKAQFPLFCRSKQKLTSSVRSVKTSAPADERRRPTAACQQTGQLKPTPPLLHPGPAFTSKMIPWPSSLVSALQLKGRGRPGSPSESDPRGWNGQFNWNPTCLP